MPLTVPNTAWSTKYILGLSEIAPDLLATCKAEVDGGGIEGTVDLTLPDLDGVLPKPLQAKGIMADRINAGLPPNLAISLTFGNP